MQVLLLLQLLMLASLWLALLLAAQFQKTREETGLLRLLPVLFAAVFVGVVCAHPPRGVAGSSIAGVDVEVRGDAEVTVAVGTELELVAFSRP